ncbi:MAG TPA: class I SAM-dependent methyltransferase [Bacillota bacterium]
MVELSKVEEKLAKSLTAETTELIPYLPYLLQDLWELGSSPRDMLEMIRKHLSVSRQTKILDLACGKGAVSVHLAKALGCMVKGIDLIPEFIAFAKEKAEEYEVDGLCQFMVGEINESIKMERDYDLVILGAVGDVLGTPEETIRKLKQTIKPEGYILLDDAYGKQEVEDGYYSREEWLLIFEKTGVRLLAEKIVAEDELIDLNHEQQGFIIKRANELKKQYPDKAGLFEGYIQSQQAECELLENDILGVTMLLQRIK